MNMPHSKCLVAWIGDDFTGSAASLEVMAFAGIPSVLFLNVPTKSQMDLFPEARAIGVATTARSQSTDWMHEHLPKYFGFLRELSPVISHYKVCSTLDSSPEIGSIGCALDIAKSIFNSSWVPVLIAAPKMRRYQAFGHLFAASGTEIHRLDRHPTMMDHPITPMRESDVAKHLMLQSAQAIYNLSLEDLSAQRENYTPPPMVDGGQVVTLDAMTDQHMACLGKLIWEGGQDGLFAVGSQGIQYALVEYWREKGWIEKQDKCAGAGPVEQVICISGSVSPQTSEQINWALKHGFEGLSVDVKSMLQTPEQTSEDIIIKALDLLASGQSLVIYTADGRQGFETKLSAAESSQIGQTLGQILKQLLQRTDIRRAIISGGDTSGHAAQQLNLFALQATSPTVPGAPLLKAFSADPKLDGLELALKGGQMGTVDFFDWIKRGGGITKRG